MITLTVTVVTLNLVHHSPLLAVCAVYTGAAAYLLSTYVSIRYLSHTGRCLVFSLSYPLLPLFFSNIDGH